ncbi:MAG: ABC transporter ATP-binding protein [Candidatus Aminicenantes bacterium]|nr:ABC transporter ATP-binding protein [Candidatus Aminicenantes bacterium]
MIRFENVSFAYEKSMPVFQSLDLVLETGLTLLLGPNGSGKTTLLKLAAGVEKPDKGTVWIGERDLWKQEVAARREIAYLPEHPDLTPYASIREITRFVCRLRGEPTARGEEALAILEMDRVAGRSVRELSQGQRRRAVLASAMIGKPQHLLLDEPLEAMDRRMRDYIMVWIEGRVRDGAAAVIVSHDLDSFAALASTAVGMKEGKPEYNPALPADLAERNTILERFARGL